MKRTGLLSLVRLSPLVFAFGLTTSCLTSGGGNWWLVDFDKQDRNYRDLGGFTSDLRIGMSTEEVYALHGDFLQLVEATTSYQTLAIEQWNAVFGDDYIIRVLYLRMEEEALVRFVIKDVPVQRVTIPVFVW